mmetsp:Transcript_11850/g.32391  ORF Transcript_11850/g.32391 Transcript_11850/m.32391 type:complete len:322 (-) Transcript_11850:759-1724(-)
MRAVLMSSGTHERLKRARSPHSGPQSSPSAPAITSPLLHTAPHPSSKRAHGCRLCNQPCCWSATPPALSMPLSKEAVPAPCMVWGAAESLKIPGQLRKAGCAATSCATSGGGSSDGASHKGSSSWGESGCSRLRCETMPPKRVSSLLGSASPREVFLTNMSPAGRLVVWAKAGLNRRSSALNTLIRTVGSESPGGGTSRVAPRFFSTRPLRKVSRASSRALGSRPVADRPASHATMHTWRDSTLASVAENLAMASSMPSRLAPSSLHPGHHTMGNSVRRSSVEGGLRVRHRSSTIWRSGWENHAVRRGWSWIRQLTRDSQG